MEKPETPTEGTEFFNTGNPNECNPDKWKVQVEHVRHEIIANITMGGSSMQVINSESIGRECHQKTNLVYQDDKLAI